MPDTELEQSQSSQTAEFKAPEKLANPGQTLEQSLGKLAKFGGFEFLEGAIDGASSLNPERKARKNIFLTEAGKKQEREDLKKKLGL